MQVNPLYQKKGPQTALFLANILVCDRDLAGKSTLAPKKRIKKTPSPFFPRVASSCVHQQHQSKANKRLAFFWMFGKDCVVKNREPKRLKNKSIANPGPKKKTPISVSPEKKFPLSGKKISRASWRKRKKRKFQDPEIPFAKRQVLFAPRVALPRTHQYLHLKSNKRLVFFLGSCMACDRELAKKMGK